MKTFVPFKQNIVRLVLFVSVTALCVLAQAQPSAELATYNNSPKIASLKLDSFTAAFTNNKADLKWATSSEINVSHFIIEKSTDGINFSDAAVMFAYGSATDKTNYSFSDKLNNVQSGVVYYRLYSVDNSGKGQYSDTRIIKTGK